MILGEFIRAAGQVFKVPGLLIAAMLAFQPALAAPPAETPVATGAAAAPAAPAYVPMQPTPGKGMPVDGALGLQPQYSPVGEDGAWIHNIVLMPVMVGISLLVLLLLIWVMIRYNRRMNPVPSKTSHNTAIEIVWTLVPVLILLLIAVPSINLIAKQYKPAPAKALTIKATGYQWYWTYSYPDNGEFEITSNMLPEEEAIRRGEPSHLAADFRMVVPAGEPIRLQVTAADVIHAFAVPSLWFKLDAVPGRINEKVLFINEPGVYYGQCSELCGVRHGYMPIVVEALPRDKYNAWVLAQSGGKIDNQPAPAVSPAAAGTPEAAPAGAPVPAASATPAPAA